jgi:hypothetical protein
VSAPAARASSSAWEHLDWLVLIVGTWFAPLALLQVLRPRLGYLCSLLFWLIPIGLLFRRFFLVTSVDPEAGVPYSRRRRALAVTLAYVLGAGLLLDFALGRWVLKFEGPSYLGRIWGVPIEECLFYALAPVAIVLVYAWIDETWLSRYNSRSRKKGLGRADRLLRPSRTLIAAGLLLFVAGIMLKRVWSEPTGGWLPIYYTFLLGLAVLPAAALHDALRDHVNWPAFAFTTLYVVSTSLIWEVTLALPLQWWGYQDAAMLGLRVAAWTGQHSMFPVEAALVWFCAPFSCALTYEGVKYFYYLPQPTTRERLLGETPHSRR